jgi:hypothetical protein
MTDPTVPVEPLWAALTVPELPLHAAPDTAPMPPWVARQLLAAEMGPAGDPGLYAGALPSILAARLQPGEVLALCAVLRALADYHAEPAVPLLAGCAHPHRLEAL